MAVLEQAKKTLKETHPDLKVTTQVKKGHPATKIVEASDEEEVDLIV